MSKDTARFEREKKTLRTMIRMYCHDLHSSGDTLCPVCTELEGYAMQRLDRCTFGPDKPKCADCPIHCYKPAMRTEIQTVMRYAGPRMMVKHPVLAIGHVMDGVRHPAGKAARRKA
jgi:hypothetical protein